MDPSERESDLEREVLRSARRGLSPSHIDRERVRVALLAALPTAPSALAENGSPAAHVASGTGRWLARLAVGVAVATGGGVGYFAGHRAGFDAGRARAAAEAPRVAEAPRLEPNERAERPAAPPAVAEAISEPVLAPAAPPKPSVVVSNAPDAGLDDEVRLLKRIERALRDENPRYALGLLGELDRTVPGGQLVEERHAARAMARCQLLGGSQAMIDEFSKAHPGSAYRTRVTEMCRGTEQRNPELPDTHR